LDVLVHVATNTSNIKLGTSVIDMFYYTPIMLAKRMDTLDVLSQGRAICGLGLGWSKDEYQASNVRFMNRGKINPIPISGLSIESRRYMIA
jgi:alkanesulfonate monooxygenase SsuD/methylene tetrahydromethanopterin reductase-like flavin-dependent oxidoreductase (luciferase family)